LAFRLRRQGTLCEARADLAGGDQFAGKLDEVGVDGLGRLDEFNGLLVPRLEGEQGIVPAFFDGARGLLLLTQEMGGGRLRGPGGEILVPAHLDGLTGKGLGLRGRNWLRQLRRRCPLRGGRGLRKSGLGSLGVPQVCGA